MCNHLVTTQDIGMKRGLLQNGAFIQGSADNIDHNVTTLDGKGAFHGMEIVAPVAPSGSFSQLSKITRLKKKNL